jgi:hypothetical protein
MTYQPPHGPRSNRPAPGVSVVVPIVAAALIILLLLWALVPSNSTRPVNDTTNAGSSTETVVPRPSTSNSPTPTPNPTTEQPNTSPAQ